MKRTFRFASVLTVAGFSLALIVGCASGSSDRQSTGHSNKIKVTKLDDLPQHTYPFTGKVRELLGSEEQIAELAAKVRANVENDLNTYEINDATTLQGMYSTLANIDLLEGKTDAALARLEQIRQLEDKEAKRLTTGLTTKAMIAARREVGENGSDAEYRAAFRRLLAAQVKDLPWDVVQDEIQESKGRLEIFTENLLMGAIEAQMQPVVDQTGELNADMASGALGVHYMLKERLPLKNEIVGVYQEFIDAHHEVKADIWAERSVTLTEDQTHGPVLVAVWDSGTDPDVFWQHLWTNEREVLDGQDTDGNGYVDDVHGIAYDINAERTTGLLCPLGDAADRIPEIMDYMKGLMDMQAAVDSPEASALKKHLGSLDPGEVRGFLEDLGLAGNYAHGTHVAGLMADGNPCVELMIARLSYDHRTVPVARTVEWGKRDGAKCHDTVEYFKKHGVRVVNMSWGEAQADAESSLEANGIGATAEERREIARKVFAFQREGLYNAIKNAPNILFVCAAGNADNDVEFDEYIASSFDLPNLLVVGAVDQAGDPTSFTSFGRTVQVYANGFEVESFIPGGQRMKMSGTSMASPNVANLAAKLLAIDPSLKPEEVISWIRLGADQKKDGGHSFLLINPKRSVESLRAYIAQNHK